MFAFAAAASPSPAVPACPSCRTGSVAVIYEVAGVPTNSHVVLATAEAAREHPRGDVRLGFCAACGFLFNTVFDAGLGAGEAVGIDPSEAAGRSDGAHADRIRVVEDFYSQPHAGESAEPARCKLTLAHVGPTFEFVSRLRRSIGARRDGAVHFLVPDAHRIVRDLAFEDVDYEHCSYFSRGSLARLMARAGFDTRHVSTEYAGRYLVIEARPALPARSIAARHDDLTEISELVRFFPGRVADKIERWRAVVQDAAAAGRRVVLWGSGSKAVSFLTTLDLTTEIEHVVDINPYRHDCYIPVTAQRIVAPDFLAGYRPDLVIVTNAVHLPEIENILTGLDISPEVRAL